MLYLPCCRSCFTAGLYKKVFQELLKKKLNGFNEIINSVDDKIVVCGIP